MSSKRRSPATARYLLARLRPLAQPIFWGPAITLVIALLFAWDYWQRPGELANYGAENSDLMNSRAAQEAVGDAENNAIGADIDNLDVLLGELRPNPSEGGKTKTEVSPAGEVDLLQMAASQAIAEPERPDSSASQDKQRSQPSRAANRPTEASIFADLSQPAGSASESPYGLTSLLGSANRSRSRSFGTYSSNALGTSSAETETAPVNQLQQALDRAAGFPAAQAPVAEESGDRPAATESLGQMSRPEIPSTSALYGSTSYGQPYIAPGAAGISSSPSPLSSGSYSTGSSPSGYSPYGTAPSASTSAPTVNNAYTQLIQPAGSPMGSPGGYSSVPSTGSPSYSSTPVQPSYSGSNGSFGTSSFSSAPSTTTLPQTNNSAFTTRSSVPGRTLGGGRIGTFSDP